ncbi:hypothetical protein F0562_013453 [Nyssa sinensis]|uniref:Iron hydrogenase large subunit C-terminal domain-containing protein n=1 Tax=Nyssa sinensis TaxID=561372 RepID=A0A5J4ZPZ9_9ASTE|nr:hypothetical protein F0562_013453 [Nyssa sinensis]
MISSACPGWICYAEKTLGSYILPYISSVKSPQQTIGAIIKHQICQKMSLRWRYAWCLGLEPRHGGVLSPLVLVKSITLVKPPQSVHPDMLILA